jgi:hypothetical protein
MGLALSGNAGLFPEWFTGNIVFAGITLSRRYCHHLFGKCIFFKDDILKTSTKPLSLLCLSNSICLKATQI